ncbi:hypothetical protein [Candidatus Mycobacterium methanotrophicum]|uniref:Uncharacterized protein n=1 Tax=Candidatus Mycobacterium methanotrophicum TaxID=2943498 RepID=A0ABY4QGN3_9MYCO|nr:hypothetical protein [Candidatus Mycobacterium methanotrophicum]UQX09647.1 hypothetical protein M5I08_15005 [Candidatus Mycobacterium methanotrophicum]
MADDLAWFTLLPQPVQAALLVNPGAALPSSQSARLPRLYRATYGTADLATEAWTLRPRYAEQLYLVKRAAGRAGTTYR